MAERDCLVLLQSRKASGYNDFIGKYYHFPRKYKGLLSNKRMEFVYYEPEKSGNGVYFGCGRLGDVFPDKREKDHYFAEIIEYKPFATDVPVKNSDGTLRESGPGYNARNAVRRTTGDILDAICLDGGVLLNFTADTHLIRVLGEELIASEVVGILELVKNSYDANASNCRVRIEQVPALPPVPKDDHLFADLKGPVILVEDDGEGMSRRIIEDGWLRPAATIKTQIKDYLKSERAGTESKQRKKHFDRIVAGLKKQYRGRLPLGEKGVGRFATHRLGNNLLIKTKTAQDAYELVLNIDWSDFDQHGDGSPKDLSSVGVSLRRQQPSRDYGRRQSGTQIIIYGGREEYQLTESIIHEINRSLLRLKSPHKAPAAFDVTFECPQVQDLASQSIDQEFTPALQLDAIVDEYGKADFDLSFMPPTSVPLAAETIKKEGYDLRLRDDANPDYWKGAGKTQRQSQCGPFSLHIDIWYRSSPWISGPEKKTFTQYLDDYGGISIYRDGLNIFPAEWGAQTDWLRLSKRHIKKGMHLSYYSMIGSLEIEQSANLHLVDKTDRQGLIENPAFKDLAALARNLILYVENVFTGKRKEYAALTTGLIREPTRLGDVTRQGSLLVDNILKRYDVAKDVSELLVQYPEPQTRREHLVSLRDSLKNLGKSLKAMQNVQDLLSEQAGYGLAIGVAVHEIAKLTANFYHGVAKLLEGGDLNETEVTSLVDSSRALKNEIRRLAPLRAVRNEPNAAFRISKAVEFCKALYERRCRKEAIQLVVDKSSDFDVFCRYGAVNQVLANLLDNSTYWLSRTKRSDRKIVIQIDGVNRRLIVADSGPDIDQSIRPYLFEPGYSLRVPPSGLGLYVCKYFMTAMKGSIFEAGRKDRIEDLTGAQLVLDFSRVPEGA